MSSWEINDLIVIKFYPFYYFITVSNDVWKVVLKKRDSYNPWNLKLSLLNK